MKRAAWGLLLCLAGLVAYLFFWPVPIDPVAWQPAPDRGMVGAFAHGQAFPGLGLQTMTLGEGPEDVARGPDGWFFTGLQDGRIVRFRPGEGAVQTLLNTGGRPLGMQFDHDGRLIVADAFRGLLAIDRDGRLTVLTDRVDGHKLMFADDLDIAADGTIWFSNASQRFDQHHWMLDFWEGRGTGQLLSYDPASGKTRVRLDGLRFANGVALGPDDAYVLVNETMAARITRLWLKGPRTGQHDVFVDGLPALPDNLSFDGRDLFWVALPSARASAFDRLAPHPWLRKLLLRLPAAWIDVVPPPVGWVAGIGTDGVVRYSIRDDSGRYSSVTSVNRYDDRLFLGSLTMHSVAWLSPPVAGN